jgi:thiol-disulfide isomerase/thioredoxin
VRGATLCAALGIALGLAGCIDAYTEKRARPAPNVPDAPDVAVDAGADTAPPIDRCAARDTYPQGPFGRGEGDVIADLSFEGADGAPVSFSTARADCAARLLLLSTSAGWCTACREEQPLLQQLSEQHAAAGLVVWVTLFENDDYAPATLRDVAAWVRRYDVTFPVVLDAPFALSAYYDRNSTPMNMLVNLETMQIVHIAIGSVDSNFENILEANL